MALTAAVIGCGRMGARPSNRLQGAIPAGWLPISHTESIISSEQLKLIALSDVDRESLSEAGRRFGIEKLYTEYEELLAIEKCDIVSVATRTPIKSDIIKKVCASGVKGIYIEKPISNSIQECSSSLELLASNSCLVSYGVNRRFHEVYRKAKEFIQNGDIGELREVVVEFGRSPLLWTHPHSMDILQFFAGEPDKVRAELFDDSVLRNGNTVDSDPVILSAQIVFKSGVRGTISQGSGFIVRLMGSSGTMTIHGDGAFIQTSSRAKHDNSDYFLEQKFYHPLSPQSATINAFDEMAKAISSTISIEDYLACISPNDIENGMRMLIGCVWSHLNGSRYVDVNDTPSDLVVTGRAGELFA